MIIVYECIRELKRPIVDGWDVIMKGELFKHLHDDTYKSIGLGNFNFTKEFF